MSGTGHEHGEDHGHHHHKETFITKYIFSQDHKMISKQYLITGLIMGIIGIAMSLLFRMQLAWPDHQFTIYEILLGKFGEDGIMDPGIYLALVTIHGTIMVFFVLTAGLSGTFSNLLIPLQIGARDMASGFLNMISYWLSYSLIFSCSSLKSIDLTAYGNRIPGRSISNLRASMILLCLSLSTTNTLRLKGS